MDVPLIVGLMVFFLLMEGFFSGFEIGIVSADRLKLRHEAAKGHRGARLAVEMLNQPEWFFVTTLVGATVAIVINSTLGTLLAVRLLGQEMAWMAVPVVAPFIWVLGEIVPKSIFQQKADYLIPRTVFLLKGGSYLFYPVLVVFSAITRWVADWVGGQGQYESFTLREEIEMMLKMPATEGDIQPMEKSMIQRMFTFTETRVRDIMAPLVDVVSLDQNATCGEAVKLAGIKHHPRLPVHVGRVDQIVGQINALDLLGEPSELLVRKFVHPIRFVPGSKGIEDLLVTMRQDKDHLAVVVDEFGGAQGIISLEDIIERVVGDLQDEYDVLEKKRGWMRKVGENEYLVNPRLDLPVLRERLGVELPDGNYETLAGFLLERFQDIPASGASLSFQKYSFTIEKANRKAIELVRIRW